MCVFACAVSTDMFVYRFHTHAYKDATCVLKTLCFKVGPLWMSLLEMDSWGDVEPPLLRYGASSTLLSI